MRFSLLGSGSSGNAALVETARSAVLVDCGLSLRELEHRLLALERSPGAIGAVLLTHEHNDHARGLETLTKTVRLTVLATAGTLRSVGRWLAPGTEVVELKRDGEVRLQDLVVQTFPVPHDARDPVGFRLSCNGASLGYVTDIGMINDLVRERLGGLDSLIVESNHDVDLVKSGPYPHRLKKRILGPFGHLSNDALADFLREADLDRLSLLCLAHLSRANNKPELAQASAALALAERNRRPALLLALADQATPLQTVGSAPAGPAPGTQIREGAETGQLRLCFD